MTPRWRTVLAISAVVAMAAVAAAAVVVAIDNAPLLSSDAPEGDLSAQVQGLRADLASARKQLAALEERLDKTQQRLARERVATAQARRLADELALADGSQKCSAPQTSEVTVEILEPEAGAALQAPVVLHLLVTEPLGCGASFYVTVDGVPYAHREARGGKGTPAKPYPYAPVKGGDPRDACVTHVFTYIQLDVSPGSHTLQVNGGCPGGASVPDTVPISTTFVVTE